MTNGDEWGRMKKQNNTSTKEALVALAVPGPNEKWRGEWGQVAKAAGEG